MFIPRGFDRTIGELPAAVKFKISLVKDFNPLLTPKHKGYTSMIMYITGSDEKELEIYL